MSTKRITLPQTQKRLSSLKVILLIIAMIIIGFIVYYSHVLHRHVSPTTKTTASVLDTATTSVNITNISTSDRTVESAESYDASSTNGDITIEIRPKSGKVGTNIELKLTGVSYDLSDNMQIFLVDSKGYQRSLGAFLTTGILSQTVRVPEMLFACELGVNCITEVNPNKGMGKLIITHGNDLNVDVSIPFELY